MANTPKKIRKAMASCMKREFKRVKRSLPGAPAVEHLNLAIMRCGARDVPKKHQRRGDSAHNRFMSKIPKRRRA